MCVCICAIIVVRTKIIYRMTPFPLFFSIVKISSLFIIVMDGVYILTPRIIRSDIILTVAYRNCLAKDFQFPCDFYSLIYNNRRVVPVPEVLDNNFVIHKSVTL